MRPRKDRPLRTPRLLPVLAALGLGAATGVPGSEPAAGIPPRRVKLDMPNSTLGKVAPALAKQAGIPFTYPDAAAGETADGLFNGKPFWDALELLADQTGNRIALQDSGRRIALVPRGRSREVSSVHGPFRVVARQVVGRYLLDDSLVIHEVQLDAHWEPRFPVFRIDTQPTVTKATDDRGTDLTPHAGSGKAHPTGAVHPATVRLGGLTRDARQVGLLRGYFTVTASEKMLTFRFDDPTAKGAKAEPREKVEAVLKGFEKDEDTWVADLDLTYPPTIPEFESFEATAWTTANRVRLVSPDGKTFAPASQAVNALGRVVSATYYFKPDAAVGKGWRLEYDVASPPVEFRVPFELKDIPLP
jgi:hypothetical protein